MSNEYIMMNENGNNGHNGSNGANGHSRRRLYEYSRAVTELISDWEGNLRWKGIKRPYSAEDVVRLRGSIQIEYTLARLGAVRLWNLLHSEPYVAALGALTGNQAVQQVKAGLKAIYLSGWQVAADANLAGQMYPDQSLYPANSVPHVVRRINQAFQRADQIQQAEGKGDSYWFAPIVTDAEAGFGGPLNVFELMKAMIEAGAAGVHFEDQLASEKKCGHMGGKVLVPTREAVDKLVAARLAADVCGVPTLLVARTEASGVDLIMGEGRFVAPRTVEIALNDGGSRRIFGERVFLVLGSRATMPEVPGIHRVWCRGERADGRRPNRDGRADALYDVARCDFHSPDSIGGAGLFARSSRTP